MGYESSAERWSPVQSVEKILLSVVSMLAGTAPYYITVTSSYHYHTHTDHMITAAPLLSPCLLVSSPVSLSPLLPPLLSPPSRLLVSSGQSRTMKVERTLTPLKCGVRTESSSTNWPRRSYASRSAFRARNIRNTRPPFFCSLFISRRTLGEQNQAASMTLVTMETHTHTVRDGLINKVMD